LNRKADIIGSKNVIFLIFKSMKPESESLSGFLIS